MDSQKIIALLPYSKPFLFVDGINYIDESNVEGHFTFDENLAFYSGHFKDNPVTPGVILVETMAQIGLVCLGIYLLKNDVVPLPFVLTSTQIDFLKPVFPNEKVVVSAKKIYFRFGKLKCDVRMYNKIGEVVCEGTISGMQISGAEQK